MIARSSRWESIFFSQRESITVQEQRGSGMRAQEVNWEGRSAFQKIGAAKRCNQQVVRHGGPELRASEKVPSKRGPETSADAAHWFEVCSDGAAASGVSELRSVNDPVPVTDGGRFTLTYPVARFSDGHTDPYAIFICALSDGGSTARFVQGGLSDSH
jgi:hypothetical protein